MPANTTRGLPYPLPTEPVAEGAQAIRNLAEALDPKLAQLIQAIAPLAATAAGFSFPNIPQTFRSLQVVGSVQAQGTTEVAVAARLNNDLTNSHESNGMLVSASAAPANAGLATANWWKVCVGGNSGGEFSAFQLFIPDYTSTRRKRYRCSAGGHVGSGVYTMATAGRYYGAAAPVTRLDFLVIGGSGLFDVGSTIALYGLP